MPDTENRLVSWSTLQEEHRPEEDQGSSHWGHQNQKTFTRDKKKVLFRSKDYENGLFLSITLSFRTFSSIFPTFSPSGGPPPLKETPEPFLHNYATLFIQGCCIITMITVLNLLCTHTVSLWCAVHQLYYVVRLQNWNVSLWFIRFT